MQTTSPAGTGDSPQPQQQQQPYGSPVGEGRSLSPSVLPQFDAATLQGNAAALAAAATAQYQSAGAQRPFTMMDQSLLQAQQKVSPGLFPFSPPGMPGGNGLLPLPRDPPQRMQSPLIYSGPANPNLLHPAPMVAGFVSPALGPADWQNQFLHVANLQKMTAGFLSPAGHPAVPMSPVIRHPAMYAGSPQHPDQILQQSQLSNMNRLPATSTPAKQVSEDPNSPIRSPSTAAKSGGGPDSTPRNADGLINEVAEHADYSSQMRPSDPSAWFGFNGPLLFPYVPALVPGANGSEMIGGQTSAQDVDVGNSNQNSVNANPSGGNTGANGENQSPSGQGEGEEMMNTMLRAKNLTDSLLSDMSVDKAIQVLQAALVLLGRPADGDSGEKGGRRVSYNNNETSVDGSALPSVKLVHPDDFKNPSTFLKIYGDPLCFAKAGPLPKKDRNGNWECSKCNNVNFPRRFRCNMCTAPRDEEGDWVVSEYARQVYERYLYLYRNQQRNSNTNDISIPVPDVHQARRHAQEQSIGSYNQGGDYNEHDNNHKRPNNQDRRRKFHRNARGGGGAGARSQHQQPSPTDERQQQRHENGKQIHALQSQHPTFSSMRSEEVMAKTDYSKGFQSAVY